MTCLSYIAKIIVTDDLVMQEPSASAAMILISFFQNILTSALKELPSNI